MTPALFAKVGEALYGPSWRNALADELGVAERTVRRWQDGTSAIPANIPQELADICRRKGSKLASLADQLMAYVRKT